MKLKWLYLYVIALMLYGLFLMPYDISEPYQISEQIGNRFIYAIGVSLSSLIVFSVITYYTFRTIPLVWEISRRESLLYMANFYMFVSLTSLTFLLGSIALSISETTLTPLRLGLITIFVYPASLYISSILGASSALCLLFFGSSRFYDFNQKINAVGIALYIAQTLIASIPTNYYGTIPHGSNIIRTLSDSLLLLLFMYSIFVTIKGIRKKMRSTSDVVIISRLKVAYTGFIFIIGFFIFYLIDELMGVPFSPWLIPAYACIILGAIFLYIGFITPSWSLKFIERASKYLP